MDPYIVVIHKKYDEILKRFPNLSIPDNNEYTKVDVVDIVDDISKTDVANKIPPRESDNDLVRFICPHCECYAEVLVMDLNCRIFRHGAFVQKNEKCEIIAQIGPIGPHESEESCNALRNNPNVAGCCKPIQLIDNGSGGYAVQKCGYI